VLVPYENAENYGIKKVVIDKCKGRDIKKIAILIGPEGGFEEEEIEILKDLNCEIVTLGPRILRTETAGMVAMSLIMYELGDIGGNV
jgi:16S rRNA (uracil1498-N3)-methyltransferase